MNPKTVSGKAVRPSARQNYLFHKQRGVVLFIALIVLVAMSLAGIGLMRSVDTSTLVAGNLAFKQASIQMADVGIEAAVNAIPAIAANPNTPIANRYFATREPENAQGVPIAINWAAVACQDAGGAAVNCADESLYRVQFVLDRLCRAATTNDSADIAEKCVTEKVEDPCKGAGKPSCAGPATVYYRVTVQVSGPRNTRTFVTGMLGRS